MPAVNGFVLAGGKSTRMGRDKALLEWHGRTLLEHMVALISGATDRVQVIGRHPLPDQAPGHGPLSGIATALKISETDANLVAAVDLPLLTEDFLKHLRSRLELSNSRLVVGKIGSQFPLCLGIRRALLPELVARLESGDWSVRRFIQDCGAEVILEAELLERGFNTSMFRNINSEEDYRTARCRPLR